MHLDKLIAEIDWIPLQRYCQITGQGASTLHMRRVNGVWQEGVQISTPPGACTYVSIKAIRAWCESKGRPVPDITGLLVERVKATRHSQVNSQEQV